MDELGIILREAREAKGLTLVEVQEEIRIGTKFLEALETGQFQQLPTPVHARGYLRNYARFLGLEPEPLLERLELSYTFKAQGKESPPLTPQPAISPQKPLRLEHDNPLFRPVNMEMGTGNSEGSTGSIMRIAIIIALLVAIALIVNRIVSLRSEATGSGSQNAGFLDVVQDFLDGELTPEPDAAATNDPTSPFPVPNTDVITSTERNQVTSIPIPTLEPTRPALPATMETVQLRLDVVERTWMRLTIDGNIVFEGQALPGELYQYEANDVANLRASNAVGIVVTVNGVQLGKLGGRQEVVDETWQTTN